MIIIRPITQKDQDIFVEFSFEAVLGMRNLPRNRDKLHEKILLSEKSFASEIQHPGSEEYLFVLEDLTTGRIGGTCGILAHVNPTKSTYYRIESVPTHAKHPSASKEMRILRIVPTFKDASEVCSLYLQPTFRHSGQGRLLSLSRFLFIAGHKERFHRKIIAEMRGFIDQRQISPFWQAVGRHFCDLSFVELMAQIDQDLISEREILPEYPIYIDLLPKEVQDILGKTHDASKPAIQMLQHEGFAFEGEIDTFEAGPIIKAYTSHIRSIKHSALIKIETTPDLLNEESEFILCNNQLDFRACYGYLEKHSTQTGIINVDVAEALRVKNGDTIRYVTLH